MAGIVDLEDEDLIAADENDFSPDEIENDIHAELNEQGEYTDALAENSNDTNVIKVSSKKKVVRNPQPKLDADKLKGPRGLIVMEDWFKDIHFKGKGHEQEDLNALMCRLEQWTNRLFPKFTFDDCLARIEKLGHKKPVANYVKRIRLDMEEPPNMSIDTVNNDKPNVDLFDSLLDDNNVTKTVDTNTDNTPTLTDDQRERMIRNRLLAEEKRQARARARNEELTMQQSQFVATVE